MRGEVRLLPYNPESATLSEVERVALVGQGGEAQWVRIVGRRPHKKYLLLRFENVVSAEDADRLIGRSVAVPRDQLPELDEGEVYHIDLIGCAVETESGDLLGRVEEIMQTGSNDVLVVRDRGHGAARESLIPVIDDVVVDIDVAAARIVIRVVPGLLGPG